MESYLIKTNGTYREIKSRLADCESSDERYSRYEIERTLGCNRFRIVDFWNYSVCFAEPSEHLGLPCNVPVSIMTGLYICGDVIISSNRIKVI